jgi:hypothetical protein
MTGADGAAKNRCAIFICGVAVPNQDLTMQQNPTSESLALNDLYPLEQFAAAYPSILTMRTLRWQLRKRDTNGLAPACVRIGKKLLISKSRYESWLSSQAGAAS